jgi:hypothetical protein
LRGEGQYDRRHLTKLKALPYESLALKISDFMLEFIMQCDTSSIAVWSVLNHEVGKKLQPIAFFNRLPTTSGKKLSMFWHLA